MRPGVPTTVPHEAAKRAIARRGFDEFRLHTTGYGIAPGFPPSWQENIQMFPNDAHVLEPGMVLSVEPPVFVHPERLGARLVDNVLITETGNLVLSQISRDLIVR